MVSCAARRRPLHIINRETGNRIRNQAIDSETGDVVETENKVKGYELDNGKYVLLEEDELDEVALESTHTLEIETFAPRDEVDEIYLDESFYIVPDETPPTRPSRSSARP
jgi:DNA end-binding protein Ku